MSAPVNEYIGSGDGVVVAVVGATGQVGRVMRALLEERGFPARAVRSNDNLSVNDDAGAHARAERKHDGAPDAVARSEPGLSKRRGVRVVERVGAGDGESGLEGCGQTGEIKNDVGGHGQRAVLEDDAGNIDADGAERLGVLSRIAHEGDCGG